MTTTEFTVYDQTSGEIVRYGVCQLEVLELQVTNKNEKVLVGNYNPNEYWANNGVIEQYPPDIILVKKQKPPYPAKWSNITFSWEDLRQPDQVINMQWDAIRSQRDMLLASTDWTMLPDAAIDLAKKSIWIEYRQALRDITTQTDPFNIIWPVEPQ